MPIYEYRCETCQNIFEILTTASATEQVACSKCGSDKVSKIISAGSIRRGSGTTLPSAGPAAGSPGCGHRGFS